MRAMRCTSRVILGAMGILLASTFALAHETSVKAHIAGVVGGASTVVLNPEQTRASWTLSSTKGGQIQLRIKKAEDAFGARSFATNNTMEMNLVINGVPSSQSANFDILNGKAKLKLPSLGLTPGDLIEVRGVTLEDSGGEVFGQLGFVVRKK